MAWKKLGTKKIFTHPRITLYEDDVELPGGKQTKYLHFGDYHDAAMVICLKENKVFVQKEFSYPPDEWLYQFPGGVIEVGEDAKVGAERELAEEGRLSGDLTKIGWYYLNNRRSAAKYHVFVATNVVKNLNATKDMEEEFEDYWFSVDEINNLIASGDIVNQTMLAAWTLFTNSTFIKKS